METEASQGRCSSAYHGVSTMPHPPPAPPPPAPLYGTAVTFIVCVWGGGAAEDRFYNTYPCIIITAKGQPDVATRCGVWCGGSALGCMCCLALCTERSRGRGVSCAAQALCEPDLPHRCPPHCHRHLLPPPPPPPPPTLLQALPAQAQADAAHPGAGARRLRPLRPQDPLRLHEGCVWASGHVGGGGGGWSCQWGGMVCGESAGARLG